MKRGQKIKKTLDKEILINYLTQKIIITKGEWVDALIEAMKKGNIQAIKEGLDRVLGKAAESIDITTKGKELPTPILGLTKKQDAILGSNRNQENISPDKED